MQGYALKPDGSYRAVSDITPLQVDEIFVTELPDISNSAIELLRSRIEARKNNSLSEAVLATQLRTATPAQAVAYIEKNVTDLQSAKDTLKLLARMLIALRDRVMPELPE